MRLSQTSPRKRHKAKHDDLLKISVREWHELYRIYEAHYLYELPFLHKRSFLNYATQATKTSSGSLLDPSISEALLAFLSMTAHLHPEFASVRGGASATLKYYTQAALRKIGDTCDEPSVEKIHALLMVGYQRWVGQGDSSGIDNIKLGIKYAQAITRERKQGETTHQSDGQNDDRARFISRESWNRTMCSCCTLDLYISLMAQRPRSIKMDEELIHLPCADRAFRFGREVKAGQPRQDTETSKKREADTQECLYDLEEGALNLFMQSVFICGKIIEDSYIHGESKEGPRDLGLDHFETKMRCQKKALPEELQLEPENTATHLFYESCGIYVRLHALYQVCMAEMGRKSSKQLVAQCCDPFFEMLKSFLESQTGAPRARIAVAGFAAYSISRTLDTALACQREIGITKTFINAMRDVWGLATEWHDDLKSRKAYPVDLGNPGPHTKARDTPGSNESDDVVQPSVYPCYRYDPIRDK